VIARPHTNMQDPHSPQGRNPRCTGNGAETSSTCLSSLRPNLPERPSSSTSPPLFSVDMWLTSSYTLICTSTDYDAWRTGHAPVTVEEVVKTLSTNAGNARAIAAGLMQDVYDVVKEDKLLDEIKGSMRFACITRKEVSPQPKEGNVLMIRSNPRLLGRSCLSSSPTSRTRFLHTLERISIEKRYRCIIPETSMIIYLGDNLLLYPKSPNSRSLLSIEPSFHL
jgi:hypothetical protein